MLNVARNKSQISKTQHLIKKVVKAYVNPVGLGAVILRNFAIAITITIRTVKQRRVEKHENDDFR
jgi:hypothetical protein